MKTKRNLTIALTILMTFSMLTSASAQTEEPFYRGGLDDQVVEAPNGAKVNEGYLDWIEGGLFGEIKVVKVAPRVWAVTGYSLNNYVFIEGDTGLIGYETGVSYGQGQRVVKMMQEKVNKPISAVIYSHSHYINGTKAYAEASKTGDIPIYAHSKAMENVTTGEGSLMRDQQNRRAGMQIGAYLPQQGADATFGIKEEHFDDPKLNVAAFLPVTHPVEDGQEVIIDGVRMVFYHIIADTNDSLIIDIPDLDTVLHNSPVAAFMLSMYTLRGDFYRKPMPMIDAIDKLIDLDAAYYIGTHTEPMENKEAIADFTAHRDLYSHIYNQSVRLINQGRSPEEMVEYIQPLKHLANHPSLYPAYVDFEYNVRAQYRGMIGWYAEEAADLHPPTTKELGENIVSMAGGVNKVIEQAQKTFDEKKYNLTAKLLTYALAVEPDSEAAKQLKADALRQMAYTTLTGIQTRNYLLTSALHLEGKLDMNAQPDLQIFGGYTSAVVMSEPPEQSVKLLVFKIDPYKSADISKVVSVSFTDKGIDKSWGIHIRNGVAEVKEYKPGEKVDANLQIPRSVWARLVTSEITLDQALRAEGVQVRGSKPVLSKVLNSFDNISS